GVWADYQLGTEVTFNRMPAVEGLSIPEAFGMFAIVGPAAYFGLLDVGQPTPGDTVVVSAAAGAVGSLVGQIARIKGCRAGALAGTPEKCRWLLEELEFDAPIDYRREDLPNALKRACPSGIDVYFDNVGGDILDICLTQMNLHGRIPICGLISQYN